MTNMKKKSHVVSDENETKLPPRLVERTIINGIRAKLPICLWGHPGIGKSEVVAGVAKKLGAQFIDIRAAYFDPVDLRGLPTTMPDPDNPLAKLTHWCRPAILPKANAPLTLILADELNRGTPMTMNAFLQAIQDKRIGEHIIPDNTYILAACNYETDGGGIQRMSSALSNRFQHIHMTHDLDDWIEWSYDAGINPTIIGFHKQNGGTQLFDMDVDAKAWPSPRTWKKLSDVSLQLLREYPMSMRKTENGKQREDRQRIFKANYAGLVGAGPAAEYFEYEQLTVDLPTPEEIFRDPDGTRMVQDIGALYAVTAGLAATVTEPTLGALIRYCMRITKEIRQAEYSVSCVKDAWKRHKGVITSCKEFKTWADHHKQLTSDFNIRDLELFVDNAYAEAEVAKIQQVQTPEVAVS